MSRPKAPRCIACDKKPARYGKERGYDDHRFCSHICGYKYAVDGTVDMQWCSKHGQWYTRHCWDCAHGDDR